MKKFLLCVLSALFIILIFSISGCSARIYELEDIIPPLMNIKTQYPYVEKIIVTDIKTGAEAEFTEGLQLDKIRMQFDGVRCMRKKLDKTYEYRYSVNFVTTDGNTVVYIDDASQEYKAYYFEIDGYRYEAARGGVDITFFENIFN